MKKRSEDENENCGWNWGWNKKGDSPVNEEIIFIILVLLFFAAASYGIVRGANSIGILEEVYAKQIGLLIDSSKPGFNMSVDISDLYNKKTKADDKILNIDNDKNRVYIGLASGEGHEFYFFNDVDVVWNLDKDNRKLYMEIVKHG